MEAQDIRWLQRFDNFKNAFKNLENGVSLIKDRELSELEKQGVIQSFEFTFELAWKMVKDYLQHNSVEVKFPRDTIKQAFRFELIENGEIWMDMLEKRNLMAHTYNLKTAQLALKLITEKYYIQLKTLKDTFTEKADNE